MAYTFTDRLGGAWEIDPPLPTVRRTCPPFEVNAVEALGRELLRVVEELEAVRRVRIIGPSPAEVMASEVRIKALGVELVRIRETAADEAMEAVGRLPNPAIVALEEQVGALTLRLADADRLADEVAALVARRVLDSRSAAADALLDFREPPRTARSDRIAALEAEVERLKGLEWGARQSLAETAGLEDRAKALEEENARLRAEVAFLGPARRLAAAGIFPDDIFTAVVDQQQRFDAELSGIREVMASGAREERADVLAHLRSLKELAEEASAPAGEIALLGALLLDFEQGDHVK